MIQLKRVTTFVLACSLFLCSQVRASHRIPIQIENHSPGAPITMGIPFAQGLLQSPDHVRLLDSSGNEVPSQVTEVTTWEPQDYSMKWIWVFFIAQSGNEYELEYGEEVRRAPLAGPLIKFKNSQRTKGYAEVDTGPLKIRVAKGETGFLDLVQFDVAGDGFDANDTIARGEHCRGSFLDILDDNGLDKSTAIVTRTVREKGSGPLHTILRVEGFYRYARTDNDPSPFVIRIHTFAGKSFIRVLHTLTYTGVPDKHKPLEGQHSAIAIKTGTMVNEASSNDPGWTEANDRIAAVGLGLDYRLSGKAECGTAYHSGSWWDPNGSKVENYPLGDPSIWTLTQTGPNPSRIPPLPNSTDEARMTGFKGEIRVGMNSEASFSRSEGWVDISDQRWGISIGIRHFLEEYPKEISIDHQNSRALAFIWSPKAEPLSLARASNDPDAGMMDNFATGLTKTSELVYHFHRAGKPADSLRKSLNYFMDPPVAHASPETYATSEVYGKFSPRMEKFETYERGLEHRFDWTIFNQHWEPWYGMIDYGDQMRFYGKKEWYGWANNEPAMDYMLWMQFMRTGNRKYYLAAEAMSKHTMDVDNIHWPKAQKYYGDTNDALDYWENQAKQSQATPYLGIGRRHAKQHFTSLLSAHVWVQGWLAAYYLTGYHRGLEIACLTADTYTNRIWGDHGLTGRRLYLSVWNMVEVWDATKKEKYLCDLNDRISRMLDLQRGPDQYGSLVMDRYGYSQVYASQGLYKYYQLTKDQKVAQALIRHARAIRDNPPWNHEYESYYSSIHSLLVGYELEGDQSFLETAIQRAEGLKTNPLPHDFDELTTQGKIAMALSDASNLPMKVQHNEGSWLGVTIWGPTQGLRIFGWTHAYNVPYLLYWMRREKER
ncbi:MAG: hypothetical protein OER04_03690 [Cyclobacteriaceae bacterium]|nr:hypothetical protein [Cyclobacteriaceae bacterium]